MSERKVLNKYYPPDFDPSKIPKLRLAKERQYTVRIMAPFNMQCKVCGEYIYKGKKFNAKTENIHTENYLGLRKYRFYIRCPKCIGEVVFKTDPENQDYTLEQGAIRLFEAAKLYQEAEEKERKQAEEDSHNPMKMLENRTKDSKLEMEVMENLEELRELNMRKAAINYEEILRQGAEQEGQSLRMQEEQDEAEIRRIFGPAGGDGIIIKRLADDEDNEEPISSTPSPASNTFKRPTDLLTDESPGPSSSPKKQRMAETSKPSSKSFLSSLVKVKKGTRTEDPASLPNHTASTTTLTSSCSNEITSDANQPTQKSATGTEEEALTSDSTSQNEQINDMPVDKNSEQVEAAEEDEHSLASSILEGLTKQKVESKRVQKEKSSGLSLLGGYDFSDSDISDSGSET